MRPEQLRLLNDSRLTDAARILGFYLSTLPAGPQEMRYDSLRVLLHNTPNVTTVGRHLQQLVVFGYARLVSSGGRGSPIYEWISAHKETQAEENSTHKILQADGSAHKETQAEAAPTTTRLTTTTTPLLSPRKDKLGGLRDYLGDVPVDTALSSGVLTEVQLVGIMGQFGPNGTQVNHVFSGVDPPERAGVLTTAILRFASEGQKFSNRLFEGYLTRARDGEYRKRTRYAATGPDGPVRTGGQTPAKAGGDRGQVFEIE